jgi:hypothetical protein
VAAAAAAGASSRPSLDLQHVSAVSDEGASSASGWTGGWVVT